MMLSRVKYSLRFWLFMLRKCLHVPGRVPRSSIKPWTSSFFDVDNKVGHRWVSF